MARHHVVITGTGRAGTTFLVQLLTRLGVETGFSLAETTNRIHPIARAGLEHDIRRDDCPYLVKQPHFCDFAQQLLQRSDIVLDQVFIPMRDLQAAAASRKFVEEQAAARQSLWHRILHLGRQKGTPGGLKQGVTSEREQEEILLKKIYNLCLTLSDAQVPVTLLGYPRLTVDSPYLFRKLGPILGHIEFEEFCSAFEATVRPELVHSFSKADICTLSAEGFRNSGDFPKTCRQNTVLRT